MNHSQPGGVTLEGLMRLAMVNPASQPASPQIATLPEFWHLDVASDLACAIGNAAAARQLAALQQPRNQVCGG
ncbi:MAG: hypothetical protein ACK4YU_01265, partial [Paracoccus sp. (in: a-proteobacteria)]